MLPLKQGYDNVPPSREKSAVSPGTAQSGRRIWRKYRAVCAYHNVPPDNISKLHIGAAGAGLTRAQQEEWLALLHNKFPEADVFYSPLSASISVHTGPDAVGIGISFR